MSKRLQVLLEERDFRELRKMARSQRMTVAEYVRQALRAAVGRKSTGAPEKKLAVLREAMRHSFPTADIDIMLSEIERGYSADEAE